MDDPHSLADKNKMVNSFQQSGKLKMGRKGTVCKDPERHPKLEVATVLKSLAGFYNTKLNFEKKLHNNIGKIILLTKNRITF